jgi:membrane associated rhomboid family serine protease
MIPLYDTIRSRKVPLVNWLLIAVNVLVFWQESKMPEGVLRSFVLTWGLIPANLIANPYGTWMTIFTSMFMHGGWFHLLSNMWVLFIFGDNVEARLGSVKYFIFYLLSGLAAAALQAYILPTSQIPVVGASGAIAGVLGAYLILFPRSRVASLVPILFIFTLVEVPAYLYLAFWFISQIFSGLMALQGSDASGVAWWAHIGGFCFGMVAAFLFLQSRKMVRR